VGDFTADYRPVLSSERVPHYNNQVTVRLKKIMGEICSWTPKEGLTSKMTSSQSVVTGWSSRK
jgi:hypothetical protein